jgi:hypothetical protein
MHMKMDKTAREAIAEPGARPGHENPCARQLVSQPEAATEEWILAWGGPMKRGVPIHPLWD